MVSTRKQIKVSGGRLCDPLESEYFLRRQKKNEMASEKTDDSRVELLEKQVAKLTDLVAKLLEKSNDSAAQSKQIIRPKKVPSSSHLKRKNVEIEDDINSEDDLDDDTAEDSDGEEEPGSTIKDFYMSDAQEEHALAMEQLAPSLAALRAELCPGQMSEGCFWKIYFVLLHPKLNKHDAELLTTPQIVQARATLLQDLPIRRRTDSDLSGIEVVEIPSEDETILVPPGKNVGSSSRFRTVRTGTSSSSTEFEEFETDKHPVQISELQIIEKSVIEEDPKVNGKSKDISSDPTIEEDGDEWLEDEPGEVGVSRGIIVDLGNEEDVSFSDLEADDDDAEGLGSKTKSPSIGSPTKEESGWVQLNKSSEGAARSGNSSSPDWLDVDIDVV